MIRTRLDDATRIELQGLRRTELAPKVRDRLEAVLLSDAGWSPPRIAAHLGWHPHTARALLKDFRTRGLEALRPGKPGPAPDRPRHDRVTAALEALLRQERTWSSRQLGEALEAQGIAIGPRQVRRYLKRMEAGYRRTASSLAHKQDLAKVERAEAVLANLKAKAADGELRLCYLDECGFAPSLPISYSWCLPGQRKRVPYEYPQGRRVNALALYEPYGPEPGLGATAFERTLKSDDLLEYLGALPGASVPRVVVLDNASLHISKAVKARRPELARAGVYLYYLPAYSPELNEIEMDQADYTSSDRWCEPTRAGYYQRRRAARTGRVLPTASDRTIRRYSMPTTVRRIAPPRL
jgi:putative transposase